MTVRDIDITEYTRRQLRISGAYYDTQEMFWKIDVSCWIHLEQLAKDEVRHANCLVIAKENLENAKTDLWKQQDHLRIMRDRIERHEKVMSDYAVTRSPMPKPVTVREINQFKADRKVENQNKQDAAVAAAALIAELAAARSMD